MNKLFCSHLRLVFHNIIITQDIESKYLGYIGVWEDVGEVGGGAMGV